MCERRRRRSEEQLADIDPDTDERPALGRFATLALARGEAARIIAHVQLDKAHRRSAECIEARQLQREQEMLLAEMLLPLAGIEMVVGRDLHTEIEFFVEPGNRIAQH